MAQQHMNSAQLEVNYANLFSKNEFAKAIEETGGLDRSGLDKMFVSEKELNKAGEAFVNRFMKENGSTEESKGQFSYSQIGKTALGMGTVGSAGFWALGQNAAATTTVGSTLGASSLTTLTGAALPTAIAGVSAAGALTVVGAGLAAYKAYKVVNSAYQKTSNHMQDKGIDSPNIMERVNKHFELKRAESITKQIASEKAMIDRLETNTAKLNDQERNAITMCSREMVKAEAQYRLHGNREVFDKAIDKIEAKVTDAKQRIQDNNLAAENRINGIRDKWREQGGLEKGDVKQIEAGAYEDKGNAKAMEYNARAKLNEEAKSEARREANADKLMEEGKAAADKDAKQLTGEINKAVDKLVSESNANHDKFKALAKTRGGAENIPVKEQGKMAALNANAFSSYKNFSDTMKGVTEKIATLGDKHGAAYENRVYAGIEKAVVNGHHQIKTNADTIKQDVQTWWTSQSKGKQSDKLGKNQEQANSEQSKGKNTVEVVHKNGKQAQDKSQSNKSKGQEQSKPKVTQQDKQKGGKMVDPKSEQTVGKQSRSRTVDKPNGSTVTGYENDTKGARSKTVTRQDGHAVSDYKHAHRSGKDAQQGKDKQLNKQASNDKSKQLDQDKGQDKGKVHKMKDHKGKSEQQDNKNRTDQNKDKGQQADSKQNKANKQQTAQSGKGKNQSGQSNSDKQQNGKSQNAQNQAQTRQQRHQAVADKMRRDGMNVKSQKTIEPKEQSQQQGKGKSQDDAISQAV